MLTDYYTADPEACGGQGAAAERRGAPAVLLVRAHARAGAACRRPYAHAGACAHAPAFGTRHVAPAEEGCSAARHRSTQPRVGC